MPSTGLQFSPVSDVARVRRRSAGLPHHRARRGRVLDVGRPAARGPLRADAAVTGPARRVALVTGAGRGIGRATAIALAAAGTPVVVAARSVDELDAVVSEIAAAGGEAAALACDLTDRAQSTTLVERAASVFGPIDILVNNAGIGSSADPRPLAEFRDPFWDETLELNLTAPYLLSKAALPHMRAQRWGRIVTVASINGRIPTPHSGAYVASKHGVIGLMRTLALEVAAEGITVNCVCPGPVRTRVNDARIAYDARAARTRDRGVRAGADADRRPPRAGGHRADGRLPRGRRRAHDHRAGLQRRRRGQHGMSAQSAGRHGRSARARLGRRAQRLRDEGWQVVAADLVPGETEAGDTGIAYRQMDVCDRDQVSSTLAAVVDEYGSLDLLVNNAGITRHRPLVDLTWEDWSAVVDVNLHGVFNCLQAAGRIMIERAAA